MSKLEDLLPELAGVFAAQESAMENVVSMLTTQVAQLVQANDQQSRQVASLEVSQQQLQDALLVLRTAYDSLAAQHSAAQASHSNTISAISVNVEALQQQVQQQVEEAESKWHSIESRLETSGVGPSESQVMDFVSGHLRDVQSKLAAHMEHRLLETSNQSYLQSQQVEAAMKSDLEILEKKFEYLSRVKMEIKDVNRKIEKQDQTIDDMRMGMELLAKSIGTGDESDSEHDNHGDDNGDGDNDNDGGERSDRKLLRCDDKTEVMDAMKRISMSDAEIQAKIDENAALFAESIPASTAAEAATARERSPSHEIADTRFVRTKSVSAISIHQAGFARSKTLDAAAHAQSTEPTLLATSRSEGYAADSESCELFEIPTKSDTSPDTSISGDAVTSDDLNDAASNSMERTSPRLEASPPVEVVAAESPEDSVEAAEVGDDAIVTAEAPPAEGPSAPVVVEEEATTQEQQQPTIDSGDEIRDVAPERSPEEDNSALEQAEESDRVVNILPSTPLRSRLASRELSALDNAAESSTRPNGAMATLHHMSTAPNIAIFYPGVSNTTTAMIRSRKASRLLKHQDSVKKDPMDSSRSDMHAPLSKDTIKALWQRMFTRFVQLKRLQILGAASPDRIFRKQNISVGVRVKRLEETSADLEEIVDVLEGSIQVNTQSVQALTQNFAQSQLDTDARIATLCEDKQVQGQMLAGLEEKLDLIELDLRRMRGSVRRDSSQAASSTAVSALTSQQQEHAVQLREHATVLEALEHSVKRVGELELPALGSKFQSVMHDFRGEMGHKLKELAKDLHQSVKRVYELQTTSETRLLQRTNVFAERLYRDVVQLSKALLMTLEMVRSAKAPQHQMAASSTKKRASLFDVGLEMLQYTFVSFQNECKASAVAEALLMRQLTSGGASSNDGDDNDGGDSRDATLRDVLLERSSAFLDELERLKKQAARSKLSAISALQSADNNDVGAAGSSSSFTDRLVIVTTAQLRALESLIPTDTSNNTGSTDTSGGTPSTHSSSSSVSNVSFQVQDLVVQLRAVLVLLLLHAELLDPHQRLQLVLSAQDAMQKNVRAHDFAVAQLGAAGASVKLMGARLDAFLEMSFVFAKDDDVKKSIQEMLSSSEGVRDTLAQQLETTQSEAQRRNETLERELAQLVARVNKKLDKDELLWTQEVIERQLQSVAKSSLGEDDLADIHRLLRGKLDKSYFNALLLEQRNRAAAQSSSGGSGNGGGVPGNVPLVGAKCISCNSELPPTKAMIKSVVKDQVQQEVAKTLARHAPSSSNSSSAVAGAGSSLSFNASTHRSMEKYKRELLGAAVVQSQQQPPPQQHKSQTRK